MIDYQTQQYKLFPLIASAYAFLFSGAELREIYFRTNSEIQQGNVDMLPEVSATCCLRSVSGDMLPEVSQCDMLPEVSVRRRHAA